MSEARAFAMGYQTAVDILKKAKLAEESLGGPGYTSKGTEGIQYALVVLDVGIELAVTQFEAWQLSQDPDFQESVAQMQRGEGREIDPTEFDNVTGM